MTLLLRLKMDLSFSLNILISLTSWLIATMLWKTEVRNHFLGFFIFTGLSSFSAAFGHAEFFSDEINNAIMLFSRLLSIWSLYYFARATLTLFNLYSFKPAKAINGITPILLVVVLIIQNTFLPVMIYGILSMAVLGSLSYSLNYRTHIRVSRPMMAGIILTLFAAVYFAFMGQMGIFKPADISHILMAIALTFMALAVRNIKLYEVDH